MAHRPEEPQPRLLLERHLAARGTTTWAWAEAEHLDGAIVQALAQGEHPCAPRQLHLIGRALGGAPVIWAQAVAAGICRCPQAMLARTLRGRLWVWLISEGLELAVAASACGAPRRALALLACSGRVSARIRASGLPAALGLTPDDPLLRPAASGCAALRSLLADGRRRHPHTVQALAEQLGVGARTLRMLLCGVVPPVFNPAVVAPLARHLGLDPERLITALVRAWQAQRPTPEARPASPALAGLIMRHCLSQGLDPEHLAKQLGCSVGQVRTWLRGRLPHAALRERLRRCLGCAPQPWAEACRAQAALRYASSPAGSSPSSASASASSALLSSSPSSPSSAESVRGPDASSTPTVVQLITTRAAAQGLDRLRWALQAGISGGVLSRLLEHGHAPRRDEVRATLMRALGIDRPTYDRAVASLYAERRAQTRHGTVPAPGPRTALQEQLLRRLYHGVATIPSLARDCGVGRTTIERVLRHGGADVRLAMREKLRAYLGLESSAFQRQLAPLDREAVDDDEEVRLLRSFRQAGAAARAALVAQAAQAARLAVHASLHPMPEPGHGVPSSAPF